MRNSLTEIAEQLRNSDKKVQLIYAFNGTGKTRLSREFKQQVAPENTEGEEEGKTEPSRRKILYYNAFTEDLFYWDNDSAKDGVFKLKIQSNTFTDWILRDRGQDQNIIDNFQRYTSDKLTPAFIENLQQVTQNGRRVNIRTFPEVTFSYSGGARPEYGIKISKGEESNFVWSVFYTLLQEVVSILDEQEPDKHDDNQFDNLEYVFIDDPVSSLDENHLIEIAIDLVKLIKSSKGELKFIVSTHNPLFYNVFGNTFKRSEQEGKNSILEKYVLKKVDDVFIDVLEHEESHFSYHLHLKEEIETAISNRSLKKYHFNYLRNILEKTAIFLGHSKWQSVLPEKFKDKIASYEERMINISSHSDYAAEEVSDLSNKAAKEIEEILEAINSTYNFKERN
ncbi:AAA family ATPase [Aeromonas sp. QDB02]|uniref:AAA family ATPase n=1 Tax=Aeromonas sp. QDB02 TaxID=2990476 RepID=UPI0022DFBA12|nr:AAA family ATPase [Aeromonas sp. QDB02]